MSWKMTLQQLLEGTGGTAVSTKSTEFSGIGTDTRAALKQTVFIALKGDRFDAHDFLAQAADQGAGAIVAHRLPAGAELAALKAKTTIVKVDDTLAALQRLGRYWRRQMKARILGVTGTNGKTTTKEFTAAILSTKLRTQYSKGSFNNHWGVPLSLLSIESGHEAAVIEMGMNHPGEIRELVGLAEPDVVAVTMVGRGHLEGVGSIEGAAAAKEEIYSAAAAGATRIFNLDNPWTKTMHEKAQAGAYGQGPRLAFASQPPAGATVDVQFLLKDAGATTLHLTGTIAGVRGEAIVPVFGAHNLNNLMLAACFALACGLSPQEIWAALPECRSGWGRNQWVSLASGAKVLFDAYNANPESMRAALENFRLLNAPKGGRKIAVLAEMREMGENAPGVHRELGEAAGQAGFDALYFFGPSKAEFERGARASGFNKTLVVSDSYEQFLASTKGPVLDPSDIVLMKGSRGMQLERVLNEWKPLDFKAKS